MKTTQKSPYLVPTYKLKIVRSDRGGPLVTLYADKASRILKDLIGDVPYEQVWLLFVDAHSRITGAFMAGQGGIHGAGLLPGDILRPVVLHGAAGFIMGHNHPSGDVTPSSADIELTKHILAVSKALGAPLLDHIIVDANTQQAYSMYEHGYLD